MGELLGSGVTEGKPGKAIDSAQHLPPLGKLSEQISEGWLWLDGLDKVLSIAQLAASSHAEDLPKPLLDFSGCAAASLQLHLSCPLAMVGSGGAAFGCFEHYRRGRYEVSPFAEA